MSSRRRFLEFRRTLEQAAAAKRAKEKVEKADRRRHLRGYLQWLRPWRASFAGIFALAVVGMGLELVLPMATRSIIDEILMVPGGDQAAKLGRLHWTAGAVAATLVFAQLLEALRNYRMSALNARVIFSLRRRLYDRLLRLPLATLTDLKTGGVVSRLSSDVDHLTGLVQMAVISPGAALLKVLATMAILVSLRWQMALVAAAMLPPLVWVSLLYVTRARPIYRSMADDRTAVDGRVAETFGGIRVVRSFQREAKERHDYSVGHHTIIRKNLLAETVHLAIDGGWSLLMPLTSLAIVWFGGTMVLAGGATIGDIVAFQMYSTMLLAPVWRIVVSLSQTQRSLAAMDRVFDLLEKEPAMPDRPGARPAPARVEELRFERLSFGYLPEKLVLHDVDLVLPGGKTIALVGASGAGKTTLTDLVARFQDPTAGAVKLNGVDLRDLQLHSYRARLGVVPQEVFLFDGTVRENISYGRRDAPFDAVRKAAERANAHRFIAELESGYDTLIGERGVKLSGGQRQRLSIARAILADPEILILDEATSSLDSESELLIQEALAQLFRDRTTFVIAHRLSTIMHADLIVVLHEGRVVETGQHAELLARGGLYAKMVKVGARAHGTGHQADS